MRGDVNMTGDVDVTGDVEVRDGRAAQRAEVVAAAAAAAAGVLVRELTELADLAAACGLYREIWRPESGNPPVTIELLRALAKAGNYAAGAFDLRTGALVGACVGFFGPPAHEELHSHIAGVLPAGRSVGFALKLHQRAWALRRDASVIAWTYDPLVRRNAYFNIVKLGARPAEYLRNFYGGMRDAINGDTDSDRLLIRWDLRLPVAAAGRPEPASFAAERDRGAVVALAATADGWPSPRTARLAAPASGVPGTVLVAVPADIEAMRVAEPDRAAAWRPALRDALEPLMAAGARVTGFDRHGWYVVTLREETR